jgi:TetR/AcrR family transcriptional regulator, ethionamide resistance regulator
VSQRVPRAEARARILAATERLLAGRRFRDLTVDAVMAEARLARTVFYRHFDGLPGVVLGMLDEMLARVVAEAAPEETSLRRMLAGLVDTVFAHRALLRAFYEAAHHDDEVEAAVRDFEARSLAATVALFRQGQANGTHRAYDPQPMARALNHLAVAFLLDPATDDPAVALETLWTIWRRTVERFDDEEDRPLSPGPSAAR